MAKPKEVPEKPVQEFTPPGGGGCYQLIDGVPVPAENAENPSTVVPAGE
ncbi:MAG: hypothetical protein U5L01_11410 [Rheinheimera sp.]|nr:hypothetical protein [Rheinheimera sp.]